MERAIANRNILDEFCLSFCRVIDQYCKYIVVSGFLAIASGRTRGTEDIDMIIERLDLNLWKNIFNELNKEGFTCMQTSNPEEAYDYLKDNTSIRFTRKDKPLPEMEVKFAKDLLDIYQLENRVKIELTGLDIWFSSVNINIAFKEEFLKSQKDLEDARHLRIVFKEEVNEEEIKKVKLMIRKLRL